MAAEVPAKDVLCEAMEYLSKLGSNLQTRSENLKDKKIRKDKLNNVLALQKAASKVLLICELSKKSLNNVETGVRKIMDNIDASQTSSRDGGKTMKSVNDGEDKPKYYYFEYKSRKLRIKKKITLKQYTSVRVLAKRMPKSMINKYPVHYDCKLYRRRKRKNAMQEDQSQCNNEKDLEDSSLSAQQEDEDGKSEKNEGNDMSVITIPDSPPRVSSVEKRKTDENEENNMSIISIPDTPKPKSGAIDGNLSESNKSANSDNERRRKSSEKSRDRSYSRDSDQSQKKTQRNQIDEKKETSEKNLELQNSKIAEKHRTEKRTKSSDSSRVQNRKNSETSSKSGKIGKERKVYKKLRIIEDSSDEDNEKINIEASSSKNSESGEKINIEATSSNNSESGEKNNIEATSSKNCESVEKINIEGSSSKNSESDVSCHEPEPKKRKISVSVGEPESSGSGDQVVLDLSPDEEEMQQNDNSVIKPMIKCVSLSKLLKPDILGKENVKKPHSRPKSSPSTMKEKTKENGRDSESRSENLAKIREQEYWTQKRKEVSSFKSKNFDINVIRLPELSIKYLNKLSLRKITHNGVTVCEISDENAVAELTDIHETAASKTKSKKQNKSDESYSERALNHNSDDDDLIAEANKVKDSLLQGSDSDSDGIEADKEKSAKKDSDTVNSAPLNNFELDNKNSDEAPLSILNNKKVEDSVNVTTQAQRAKNALCNNSNSDSDKIEIEPAIAQNEIVKNTLLNDSDSETENKTTSDTVQAEEVKETGQNVSNSKSQIAPLKLVFWSDTENLKTNTTELVAATESKDDGSQSEKDKNGNEKEQDNLFIQQNDENLSEVHRNEKTPEKEASRDSSDDKTKTPLSQRMTPQLKKKRMRESMRAKKMLLTYSSSSDTEDEELKKALKEIKQYLLHGSDEENNAKKPESKCNSRGSTPSTSSIDIEKIRHNSDIANEKKIKNIEKKHRRRSDSEDSAEKENSDSPKSSSSKMVRSKSKPGNSSSQNSDAQDSNDKDIDGLTNLESLNKTKVRRRRSNSSDKTEGSSGSTSRSRKTKLKPTGLICAEMLKAESSSDLTASEDDKLDDNDLPTVTIPSFNGGGEHLVKEDLLGESDSSLTGDEKVNKDESDNEEKLNSRRRKANAMISSDSEVGSSRKKAADVKLSDFDDSDDSVTKRSKRKKVVDSDASVGSGSSNEGGKKKRRRIKPLRDSDDMSGSESETEGRNKHGRKNIRKVMGKNQLEEATKKAAREEKERIARIAERQKMYNNLEFDESGKPDEVVLDKVILDFDPGTKEPLIEVDRGLVKKLKPHQANGIKFMWDACFESAKRIRKDRGSGCILAHCMGLGKTLQVVTLTHTLLTHSDLTRVNRVLVVCPLSTVLNWVNEFRMWLKYAETEYDVDVFELSRYKQNSERAFQLSQWYEHGGVCVLGYEMFRNLSADNTKKFKKKMLKNFQEALVDPGPDLVVCDEGHLLKNEKTSLSQSMNRIKTLRRIVLTGTPLQNNLKEYYCMVQFVKPNLLGKYNEYLNRFVNPITNGQYTDSTEHDIKIMKRRSHVLHKMLDGAVQRRDYGVLAPFLPPKHEYVLFITLAEVQTKLYQHYLDNFSRRPLPGKSSGFLFPDFQSLQRIWTHPLVLKYNSERYEIMQQKKRDKEEEDSEGSLVDFIDDDSTPDETSTEESSDDSSDLSDDSRKKSKKKKSSKKNKGKGKDKEKEKDIIKDEGGQSRPRRGTRANPIDLDEDEKDDDVVEVKNENPTEWWIKLVVEDELDDMRNSHKLVLLFDILRQCDTIGDKLLVFSQSLYSLDLIEHFLGKVDEATQEGRIDEKLGGHVGSWSPGVDYFRLDGSTSCENRSIWCKNFNREDNPRARLFLISTRAGGLGINLVAANRVVIFDVSWNPSHDVQSIFRVYRFGQKKPCYVYRFLAMGTMEEKIYERQVTKQAISKRVIDEQQIDRHYAENDLAELYKFEPTPPAPRPIPPLPKDRLFAEMLREHEAQIYKYHEHDSLLENKEEETLSEEERKAAWEDFENEKNKPPPAPFPNTWPMHNGMMSPGLLVQQQQLAYAALAAMLRKDMPNLNDNQLRDMLPLIYNANPQLMQKMSEMYKYPQPGMMSPAMMNPGVMSAAGGGGGMSGMGGASGLQYEPPWQRQQQHQQQMRLQQLMQQQNQMGAKLYAGGLGSRDPVAMALQQQRAREIMLGGAAAAARPRGRPPLQPRAPPSGDVVNLDSD